MMRNPLEMLTIRHRIFIGLSLVLWVLFGPLLGFWPWLGPVLLHLTLLYIAWNLSFAVNRLDAIPKKRVVSKGKAVFITGCDTGFGHLLATRLVNLGFYVFAGCLQPNTNGAQDLRFNHSESTLTLVPLDVTSDESVTKARDLVKRKLEQLGVTLWGVVNNAGVLSLGEVEFGNLEPFRRQIEINTLGVVRVTKAFLPLIRVNFEGRVVNIASLAGRFSMPGFVGYCMSKCAVIAFSDGLRREIAKWNVQVVCIEPHLYRTNLVNRDRLNTEYEHQWTQTEPEIQNQYGRSYYDGFIRTMSRVIDTSRSSIPDVVRTLQNALTLEEVETHYQVMMPFERVRVWLWSNFAPQALLDFLMKRYLTDGNGTPALLMQKMQNEQAKSTSGQVTPNRKSKSKRK